MFIILAIPDGLHKKYPEMRCLVAVNAGFFIITIKLHSAMSDCLWNITNRLINRARFLLTESIALI